jgi:hypothetical protein
LYHSSLYISVIKKLLRKRSLQQQQKAAAANYFIRTMTMRMKISCLLTIQAFLLCSSAVVSSEDPKQNNKSNIRTVRKRVDEYGEITNEAKNDIEVGRQYLESLWDSVEKNHERKLVDGRMPYLQSMMSMMSMPTNAPSKQAPSNSPPTPTSPTAPVPEPTPAPRGPTLPTREPIPTKAPIPPPSTAVPTENPTIPIPSPTPAPFFPASPCFEGEKDVFVLEVLSRTTEESVLLDPETPQGMAFSFLLEEEPSFVCTPTFVQRYGLSTFYFAMGGETWTNSDKWLGHTHACEWFGVDCNESQFSTNLNLGT